MRWGCQTAGWPLKAEDGSRRPAKRASSRVVAAVTPAVIRDVGENICRSWAADRDYHAIFNCDGVRRDNGGGARAIQRGVPDEINHAIASRRIRCSSVLAESVPPPIRSVPFVPKTPTFTISALTLALLKVMVPLPSMNLEERPTHIIGATVEIDRRAGRRVTAINLKGRIGSNCSGA